MAFDHPAYVLVGTEPVRRRLLLARLKAKSGEWERTSAQTATPGEVLQPTLFADPDRPLVRVVSDYSKWTASQRKQFAAAIGQLTPGVCVVILCDRLGDKDPLRSALAPESIISVVQPRPGTYVSWLSAHARRERIDLDADAAHELIVRVGENTEALSSELDKLHVAADGQTIDMALVRNLIAASVQAKAWDWADALVAGARGDATSALAACEWAGESPLALTGVLHGRLLTMAWVHLGVTPEQVNVKPYPWKLAREATVRGWTAERVRVALSTLAELEAGLKGASTLPEWTQMAAFTARTSAG